MPASANMKIVMTEDSEMLEDVVVIGYGSVKEVGCNRLGNSH